MQNKKLGFRAADFKLGHDCGSLSFKLGFAGDFLGYTKEIELHITYTSGSKCA